MALSGEQKIVITIKPHFHRTARCTAGKRCPDGHLPSLGFLATKTATHTPAFHANLVIGDTQGMSDPVLNLPGMLGA